MATLEACCHAAGRDFIFCRIVFSAVIDTVPCTSILLAPVPLANILGETEGVLYSTKLNVLNRSATMDQNAASNLIKDM